MNVPLPVVQTGPEDLFRLGPVTSDGQSVAASMPSGAWLVDTDGVVAPGAVGVLVDNVLGYAIIAARPPGHWSVSAEITLDVLEPLPTSGAIHAEARVEHIDGLGGFATARVLDDEGRLLALGTQRGRFVAAHGVGLEPASYTPVDGSDDVIAWLRRTSAGARPFEVPDLLLNPMGNVHGGVSFCLSDLVARDAVAGDLTTASIHVVYSRGIPAGATLSYDAVVTHAGRSLAVVEVTGSVDGRPSTLATVVLHPHTS